MLRSSTKWGETKSEKGRCIRIRLEELRVVIVRRIDGWEVVLQ